MSIRISQCIKQRSQSFITAARGLDHGLLILRGIISMTSRASRLERVQTVKKASTLIQQTW